MAKIVFRLNGVPEDEADAVREVLTQQAIDYYETSEGRWGISVAAIWIKDDADFAQARHVIDEFQQSYSIEMNKQYQEDLQQGRIPTFWQLLKASPAMVILYGVLICMVIALTLVPMFSFFN